MENTFNISIHYASVYFRNNEGTREITHKPLWWELLYKFMKKERGFDVFKDPRIEKNYKCLSNTHRQGIKGYLEFKSDVYPAGFKIDFFQNLVFENSSGGQYDFDKFDKMPYLIKKSFLNELNHIRKFLSEKGITENSDPVLKTSGEKVFNHICEYRRQHHQSTPFESLEMCVGHSPDQDYNNRDRDKKQLFNGQVKYFRDCEGRLNRGVVYHNINNMWWVVVNKNEYRNKASFDFFDCNPLEVPRKEYYRRKQRLETEKAKAIKSENYEKAAIIRDLLKLKEAS